MKQAKQYDLLDFLVEIFLQQGASVSYRNLSGTPAIRITVEMSRHGFILLRKKRCLN